MGHGCDLKALKDGELRRRLVAAIESSRGTEAGVVACIAEFDKRKLYARDASPSMFAWCREVLHLSEAEAYLRIRAARASRKYPVILKMLADGRLHLSAIEKIAPYLDKDGATSLLARASHRSKLEIQQLIAGIAPRPDVKQSLRRLPEAPGATSPPASLLDQKLLNGGMSSPVTTVGRLVDPEPTAGGRGSGLLATSGTRTAAPATTTATAEPAGALFSREHVAAEPNATPTALAARVVASRGLRPDAVEPLSPGRYALHLTLDADQHARLQRLRALTGGVDLAE